MANEGNSTEEFGEEQSGLVVKEEVRDQELWMLAKEDGNQESYC